MYFVSNFLAMKIKYTPLIIVFLILSFNSALKAQFTQVSSTLTDCTDSFVITNDVYSTYAAMGTDDICRILISIPEASKIKFTINSDGLKNADRFIIFNGNNYADSIYKNYTALEPTTFYSSGNIVKIEFKNSSTAGSSIDVSWQGILNSSATITNVQCFGDATGAIDLATTYSTSNIDWYDIIADPSNSISSSIDLSNVVASEYRVVIGDATECTLVDTFIITQPESALAATIEQTQISCFGADNGSAKVTASGGSGLYTYLWDNGRTKDTLLNLSPALYTVTITDKLNTGCSVQKNITIDENLEITAIATQTKISCNSADDGKAVVSASGGSSSFNYLWDNGSTITTADNLTPALHNVTITDATYTHCSIQKSVTVTENPAITTSISEVKKPCFGINDGQAQVSASGGSTSFNYNWSDSKGTNALATNLSPSVTYYCTITDASAGCDEVLNISLTQNPSITATAEQTKISCFGADDGEALITASGGSTNLSYSWDNGSSITSSINLTPGAHTVTVVDDNVSGCDVVKTVTITENPEITATVSETKKACWGTSDGKAEVIASGGTNVFTYAWDNTQTTTIATNLSVGDHDVTITDANHTSCELIKTVTITQNSDITYSNTNSNYNSFGVSCNGDSDGWIKVIPANGTAPYTYLWNTDAGDQTTQKAENLSTGTNYIVTITDAYDCTATSNPLSLNEPNPLNIVETITHVTTYNGNNGSIVITVPDTAGTSSLYWSGLNTVDNIGTQSGLTAGNYSITVVDGNNCTANESYTINQPSSALDGGEIRYGGLLQDYACYSTTEFQMDNLTGYSGGNTDSTYTYSWQYSTNLSTWTTISSTNVDNYKWTSALTTDTYFRRKVTNAGVSAYSDTIFFEFISRPTLSISNLKTSYCFNADTLTLFGSPTNAYGEFLGEGILNNTNGVAQFLPSTADTISINPISITYRYNEHGCITDLVKTSKINPVPEPYFLLPNTISKSDASYTITGKTPADGIFTGESVTAAGKIYTADLSVGNLTITYTAENSYGCSNYYSDSTLIVDGNGYFSTDIDGNNEIKDIYCTYEEPWTIYVKPLNYGSSGTFDSYITQINDTTGYFDPTKYNFAVDNTYSVTYTFKNASGFVNTITKEIRVYDVSNEAEIQNLNTQYCNYNQVISINGKPLENSDIGVFSGSGITPTGNGLANFDINAASGSSPVTIQYVYTQIISGCRDTAKTDVNIYLKPDLSMRLNTVYNYNGTNDTLHATPSGGSFTPLTYFNFTTDTIFVPKKAGLGNKSITYSYTDANGCTNSKTKTTDIQQTSAVYNNLNDAYCYVDQDYTISVTDINNPTDAIGTFRGYGIVNLGNNLALFNPKLAYDELKAANPLTDSTATILVSFEYLGTNDTTVFSISKSVKVRNNGSIVMTSFKKTTEFCSNLETFDLEATPLNGIFSGEGVINNTFDPGIVSGTTTMITYTYIDVEVGCTISKQQEVTILPLPTPTIDFNAKICMDAGTQVLVGHPRGGEFFSTSIPLTPLNSFVDSVKFDPGANLVGIKTINYRYVEPSNFCTDTVTKQIEIDTLPNIGISITKPAKGFCMVDENVAIQGLLDGNNASKGIFKGDGIVDTLLNTGRNQFNPILIEEDGVHTLTFIYTDNNGCVNKATTDVKVNYLPEVNFIGLNDNVCSNEGNLVINASPTSGTGLISIDGTTYSGYTTTLALNSYAKENKNDTISVVYKNTDANECTNSISNSIIVRYSPSMAFDVSNLCIASPIQIFYQGATNTEDIDSTRWKIGEDVYFYNTLSPSYLFDVSGKKQIAFYMELKNGCNYDTVQTFTMENNPNANFTWQKECVTDNATTFIPEIGEINTDYYEFNWDFGDGTTDTDLNVSHKYATMGSYPVKFIVNSNSSNCSDTAIKMLTIRPTYVMNELGAYNQSFEDGTDGWMPETLTNDTIGYSWAWGVPDGAIIKNTPYGEKVYVTSLDSNYYNYENSAVTSPCFDFTDFDRPMISLSLFKQMENNKDGAVLEYSTNFGETWTRLGDETDGIEWYNSNNVTSNPGAGGTRGWTDTTSQWVEARHDLDELIGFDNIRFRIAFKADNSLTYEGFAFDNIKISQRERTVLVEHFTNYESSKALSSDKIINALTSYNLHDAIDIQYQSSYSTNNEIYNSYQMGVSTRESYYNITSVPYTYFDGTENFSFSDADHTPTATELMSRALTDPEFAIDLQTTNNGSSLVINIQLEALKAMTNRQLQILTAVLEKEINFDPGTGEMILENVLRRFIPGPGGAYLDKNWAIGQTAQLTYNYDLPPYFEKGDSAIIVTFIQDELSKEILQAATDGATGQSSQTSIEDWFTGTKGIDFMIFPNPASNEISITFSQIPEEQAQINLLNQQGAIVKSFKPDNAWYTQFNLDDLQSGVYFVQWKNGTEQKIKKLIVFN